MNQIKVKSIVTAAFGDGPKVDMMVLSIMDHNAIVTGTDTSGVPFTRKVALVGLAVKNGSNGHAAHVEAPLPLPVYVPVGPVVEHQAKVATSTEPPAVPGKQPRKSPKEAHAAQHKYETNAEYRREFLRSAVEHVKFGPVNGISLTALSGELRDSGFPNTVATVGPKIDALVRYGVLSKCRKKQEKNGYPATMYSFRTSGLLDKAIDGIGREMGATQAVDDTVRRAVTVASDQSEQSAVLKRVAGLEDVILKLTTQLQAAAAASAVPVATPAAAPR